jgi:transcriptional regulator with XRE-family HTH domain
MSVAERLAEERRRVGLNQTELGQIAGVGKLTVIRWERGESAPDAQQLAAMAIKGIDVQYLVTGQRSAATQLLTPKQAEAGLAVEVVTKEERALLDNYRHAPEIGKKAVDAAVAAVTVQKPRRRPGM